MTAEQLVNVRDILNTTVRPLLPDTFPQNPVLGVTQTSKRHLSIMTCPSVSAAALLTHKNVLIRELDTKQLFCDGIQDNSQSPVYMDHLGQILPNIQDWHVSHWKPHPNTPHQSDLPLQRCPAQIDHPSPSGLPYFDC